VPRLARVSFELRHLRAFVAVAEELNFTRAAERLHLAQQALSKQIRQLEDQLGVQLLDRTTRRVELTLAGQGFLERARMVLAAAEAAADTARQLAGERATLRIGFAGTAGREQLGPAIEAFRERRPDVDVRLSFGELLEPTGGLRDGAVDVAGLSGRFDRTGLELEPVGSTPLGVAMAAGHPLAARRSVTIPEYAAEPTFLFPSPDPAFRDFWMGSEHRAGRMPRVVAEFRSLDGLIEAVRAGLGVQLSTELLVEAAGSGLAWRPLEGVSPLERYVARRSGDEREQVLAFVETARAARAVERPAA
jgi:DNA-binding transcriptional LysR family regulator